MKARCFYEIKLFIPRNSHDPTSTDRTEHVLVEAVSPRAALILCTELGETKSVISVFRSCITKVRLRGEKK